MRVKIESLDHEGRGIARHEGKVVFVEGALPGEDVSCTVTKRRPSYDQALLDHVHAASADRVEPGCRHFVICGGCSMQHLNARAQVATKQRVLEDSLWHIGRLHAESMLPAIHGPDWGDRKSVV